MLFRITFPQGGCGCGVCGCVGVCVCVCVWGGGGGQHIGGKWSTTPNTTRTISCICWSTLDVYSIWQCTSDANGITSIQYSKIKSCNIPKVTGIFDSKNAIRHHPFAYMCVYLGCAQHLEILFEVSHTYLYVCNSFHMVCIAVSAINVS